MFPFQSGGELSFGNSNDIILENINNTFTNCTPNNHFLDDNTTSNLDIKRPKNKRGRSKATNKGQNNNNKNDANVDNNNNNNNEISGNDKKRISHREVERQRRQEMSNLHSSLRSLLPVEYIRGKRSICDHVTEATRYITELEKSVKELGLKRDKLKDSIPPSEPPPPPQQQPKININNNGDGDIIGCSSSSSTTTTTSSSSKSEYNVSIHKFSTTIQIEIVAGLVVGGDDEDPYPLSKVLRVLANEGFDVASCISSKVNQRRMYVIYCEVDDVVSFDSSYLQEKLMSAVSSCST